MTQCQYCDKHIDTGSVFCNHCGAMVEREAFDSKKFGKWSWGAFFLGWVFLGFMNYRNWWVFLALEFITLTISVIPGKLTMWSGLVFSLIMLFYLGTNGRKIAWKHGHWKSEDDFHKLQRKWDIAGFVIILLFIGLTMFVYLS